MPMATTTVDNTPVIFQFNVDTTVDPSLFSQLISIQDRRRVLTVVNNSRRVDIAVYSGNIRHASRLLRVVPPMSTGTVLIPRAEDRCLLSGIRSMSPQASGIQDLQDTHIATGETVVAVLSDRRVLEDSSHPFFSTTPPSRQPDTHRFGPQYGTLDSHLIKPIVNNRISPDGEEGLAFVGVHSHPVLSQNLGLSYTSDPLDPFLRFPRSQWSFHTRDIDIRNITRGPRTESFTSPAYQFPVVSLTVLLQCTAVPSGGTLDIRVQNRIGPIWVEQSSSLLTLGVGDHVLAVNRLAPRPLGPEWRIRINHHIPGTYQYALHARGTGF